MAKRNPLGYDRIYRECLKGQNIQGRANQDKKEK